MNNRIALCGARPARTAVAVCKSLMPACAGLVLTLLGACSQGERPVHDLHRTSTGEIAISNLNAQIDHWSQSETVAPGKPINEKRRASLIYALTTRAAIRLSVDDYGRALTLARQWTERAPESGEAWLALAHVRAALHFFDQAREDLRKAETFGAPATRVAAARCGLQPVMGRYDQALSCARAAVGLRQTPSNLSSLAGVLGDLAQYEAAASAYARAWDIYKDPSPFMPVYLAFGEARMWMSAGQPERAEALLDDASRRLPQHLGVIVEHAVALEALGRREAAIARLKPLLDETDDPDVPNLLAIWLADANKPERSAQLARRAEQGFEQRMQRFPEAFAAHAAEYWLGPGDNADKALELARLNLSHGPAVNPLALMAQAAEAAGKSEAACDAAAKFLATGDQAEAAKRPGSTAQAMREIVDRCR